MTAVTASGYQDGDLFELYDDARTYNLCTLTVFLLAGRWRREKPEAAQSVVNLLLAVLL
jgi:hypothetical protein